MALTSDGAEVWQTAVSEVYQARYFRRNALNEGFASRNGRIKRKKYIPVMMTSCVDACGLSLLDVGYLMTVFTPWWGNSVGGDTERLMLMIYAKVFRYCLKRLDRTR